MARKKIRAINLIPVNGVYHPTEPLDDETLARVRSYAPDREISAEVISPEDKAEFGRKVMERVNRTLSDYYTAHPDEYRRLLTSIKKQEVNAS